MFTAQNHYTIAFCSQLLFSATITFNSYPLNVKDFFLYFLQVCTDNYIRQWHFCPPFIVIGASKFPNLTHTPDAMGAPALPSGNLDNGHNIPGSSSSSSPTFKLPLLKELSIRNKCAVRKSHSYWMLSSGPLLRWVWNIKLSTFIGSWGKGGSSRKHLLLLHWLC